MSVAPMEAAAPAGLLEGTVALDARTLDIIERRKTAALPLRRGWLMRRLLLLADVVGLSLAFLSAMLVAASGSVDHVAPLGELLLFFLTLPGWVVVARLHGLYDRDDERADHSTADDVVGVFHLVTIGVWLFYLGTLATHVAAPPVTRLAGFWLLAVILVSAGRAIVRGACRRTIAYQQNAIIIGAGEVGQLTARKLLQHPEYGINVVGFVDDQPRERHDDLEHLGLLGEAADLRELVDSLQIDRVIIAFSNDSHEDELALIRSIRDLDIQIDIVPRLFEIVGAKVGVHNIEGIPLVGLPPMRLSRSSRLLKRTMDLALAGVGLLILAPALLLVGVLIKLDSRGAILFRQVRMGAGERTFRIYKFRTMHADAEERKAEVAHLNIHAKSGGDPRMFKVPDDPRVTRVGRFLRRTRIDELPQLINVLRGEMSLVGPRPLILDEDQCVETWARKRLDLRPGITGLWQVLGASDIPFKEMTTLDYLYVTNWSLSEDLRLLLRTLPSLARRRMAY